MLEVLKQEHDTKPFMARIENDLSILLGSCIKCHWWNPRKLVSNRDLVRDFHPDFVLHWKKLNVEIREIKPRIMRPKKNDKGWAMYCERCF